MTAGAGAGRTTSFGGGRTPAARTLTVTCPGCSGNGALTYRGLTGPEAHEPCGTCRRQGTLDVRPESDPRRLWHGEDGQYVETDFGPFWINADLYVLDGAGDTVLVEDADADCSSCGATLMEGTTVPLCPRCRLTHRAHGRLDAERQRQERGAA